MKRSKISNNMQAYENFYDQLGKFEGEQKSPQRPVDPVFFNKKQRKVYQLVHQKVTEKIPSNPLRLIVQGTAGTGKSAIINAITTLLRKQKKQYRVCSFTGAASYLVGGSKIHKTFRLPLFSQNCEPHTSNPDIVRYLKNVEFVIIDEMSLLGLRLFGLISERLKYAQGVDFPFGKASVLLLGDFSQICPVGDHPLYKTDNSTQPDELELAGQNAYQTFGKAVILEESLRQAGAEQEVFRQMLLRIRRGELTEDDIGRLNQRYVRNLPESEWQTFADPGVVYLFAEKNCVSKYNKYRLDLLKTEKQLFYPIDSKTAPPGFPPIELAIGCRVFLQININVAAGLFNGSLGTVTSFGPPRPDGKGPEAVFVKFDNYIGPPWKYAKTPGEIPILRHKIPAYSMVHQISWTQEQIPLELSFSISTHKAQGSELSKIVIGLPEGPGQNSLFFRLCPAIFFTTLSRVRSLNDVAFSKPFNPAVVVRQYPGNNLKNWLAEEKRLVKLDSNC